MRVVMLEADEKMLAERARLGHDRWDEMWCGELHMAPAPSRRHQELKAELAAALRPAAKALGLRVTGEIAVFRAPDDYRIPDIAVYARPETSPAGIVGAPALVIEVRSPHDESDAKVPWYLARGAKEVVVIDRDTLAIDVHRPDGSTDPILQTLGVTLATTADGTLTVDGIALEL